MDGMLAGGMEKLMGGIDMRDPRVQRAARLLAAQGVPITRANLAEAMAMETGAPQQPEAPQPKGMLKGPAMGEAKVDPNSAQGRAMQKGKDAQGSTKGLTPEQKRRFFGTK